MLYLNFESWQMPNAFFWVQRRINSDKFPVHVPPIIFDTTFYDMLLVYDMSNSIL